MAAERDWASFNEFIQLYPAQTACGYTISPSKESLSLLCLGPHGQLQLFVTLYTTAPQRIHSWLHTHSYDFRFLYFGTINCQLLLYSSCLYSITCLLCLWPLTYCLQWNETVLLNHKKALSGLWLWSVYEEKRIALFGGRRVIVEVRGLNCSFAKSFPIRTIKSQKQIQQLYRGHSGLELR